FNRVRAAGVNALLVIAARHPERFDEVERVCRHEGLAAVRRTELPIDAEPRADAVVLDTIGELAQLYQIATVVFVGGSLVPAGGSGKTRVVETLARLLRNHGERAVILTRGYGRRDPTEGVLVVSDGTRVLEPVTRSGDEPQLLARNVPGVPVLVSADRYIAGLFAEKHFQPTVSILDDGFQHLQLERDVDLLLVSPADLDDRVLPAGRLREPIA